MLKAALVLAAVGIVAVSSQAADLRVIPKKQPEAPTSIACVEESSCEGACMNGKGCRVLTCANKTWRWFGQKCGGTNGAKCGQHPRCP